MNTTPITRASLEEYLTTNRSHNFEHIELTNKKGVPVRCRITGKLKTWKTRPEEFKLPVKYGLYDSFYLTQDNASEWRFVDYV